MTALIIPVKIKKLGDRQFQNTTMHIPENDHQFLKNYTIEVIEIEEKHKNIAAIFLVDKNGNDIMTRTIIKGFKDCYEIGFKKLIEDVKNLNKPVFQLEEGDLT